MSKKYLCWIFLSFFLCNINYLLFVPFRSTKKIIYFCYKSRIICFNLWGKNGWVSMLFLVNGHILKQIFFKILTNMKTTTNLTDESMIRYYWLH